MVALVQRRQKQFSRRNSVVPKIIRYSASAALVRRLSSWVFVLLFVAVFVILARYIFASTIFSSDYTIRAVRYDSGSVSLFDDPILYSTITNALQGKNYYMTKIFSQRRIFHDMQDVFPMIRSMDLFFLEKHTAAVSLQFYDPLMIIVAGQNKFAVYDAFTIVPLFEQNTLGQEVLHIQLAEYMDDVDSLDGLFFRISPEMLYSHLLLFDNYFKKPYTVVYFPGGEKIEITAADGKVLYINILGDVQLQLAKIDLLKKYYSDFDRLWKFDLGSLDQHTVIVRR